MSKNHPRCPVCGGACTKHGTTSTGRQRWRCRTCKATFTRANDDAVQAKWFRLFISWLTSGRSLAETAKTCGVSTRTLQRRFTPFWLIQPPRSVDKQRIYDQIFIDGTYFNTKCLVVVADASHVINWFWCTKESSWSYMRLLDPLAPPRLVTSDGPDPRKVDTSGVSYAAWVSVADVSASKSLGARRLHQECRLRVL